MEQKDGQGCGWHGGVIVARGKGANVTGVPGRFFTQSGAQPLFMRTCPSHTFSAGARKRGGAKFRRRGSNRDGKHRETGRGVNPLPSAVMGKGAVLVTPPPTASSCSVGVRWSWRVSMGGIGALAVQPGGRGRSRRYHWPACDQPPPRNSAIPSTPATPGRRDGNGKRDSGG